MDKPLESSLVVKAELGNPLIRVGFVHESVTNDGEQKCAELQEAMELAHRSAWAPQLINKDA